MSNMNLRDKISVKKENIRFYGRMAEDYDVARLRHYGFPIIDAERLKRFMVWEKGGLVLEIGAGTGYAYEVCSPDAEPRIWISTDISPVMLKVLRTRHSTTTAVLCDAEALPFKPGSFNYVVCSSLMHHLPDDDGILWETHRVLKGKGAFIALHEPNTEGCDLWMALRHLAEKYGDRHGLRLLSQRLFKGRDGIRGIFSYEMSQEELDALDRCEIRGAIMCPTKTKNRGGVSPGKTRKKADRIFRRTALSRFGLLCEAATVFSIIFHRRCPLYILRLARRLDEVLSAMPLPPFFCDMMLLCFKGAAADDR